MICNLCQYLEAEELSCRRTAKTIHESQAHQEWTKTAELLLERRREHVKVCKKCSKE